MRPTLRPKPITIDGRHGVIVFLDTDRQPVSPDDATAVLARAVFDDGGRATYQVTPPRRDLGGPGSGNFGHAGRPGAVGGSTSEGDDRSVTEAQSKAQSETQAAELAPGGRFETDAQRSEAQMAVQDRLKKLLPEGESAIITSNAPQLIRAGEQVADLLEEMKTQGLDMPDSIVVAHDAGSGVHASVKGKGGRDASGERVVLKRTLQVHIPETLPNDVSLDDAVASSFSKPSDVHPLGAVGDREYTKYDAFAVRTMRDAITHEMGHVQVSWQVKAGHLGHMPIPELLQRGTFPTRMAVDRAAMRVSEYASTSADEFVAEAFTRLRRGETLADDSQKLYAALNGPKVKKS